MHTVETEMDRPEPEEPDKLRLLLDGVEALKTLVMGNESGNCAKCSQQSNSIHIKLDKVIRQLDFVTEEQKKMSKMVQSLEKAVKGQNSLKRASRNGDEAPVAEKVAKKTDGDLNYAGSLWAKDLLFVGDSVWSKAKAVQDIKAELDHFEEGGLNLRYAVNAENPTKISCLYDAQRCKILFAIPPGIRKVALSIGTDDILAEENLITTKDADIGKVRKRNDKILRPKIDSLFALVRQLLDQGKIVVLVLPPHGRKGREIFEQWRDLVLEEGGRSSAGASRLKIVNMPDIMRKSRKEFSSLEEWLNMWLEKDESERSNVLTDYGSRRLIDTIRRILLVRPVGGSNGFGCERCLKQHPGGEEMCRSKEMACRKCGLVGHFDVVHNVTDLKHQIAILKVLNINLTPEESFFTLQMPGQQSCFQSDALNDWYAPSTK